MGERRDEETFFRFERPGAKEIITKEVRCSTDFFFSFK